MSQKPCLSCGGRRAGKLGLCRPCRKSAATVEAVLDPAWEAVGIPLWLRSPKVVVGKEISSWPPLPPRTDGDFTH